MRRGRDGDVIEDEAEHVVEDIPHDCRAGWLQDDDRAPRPCLICRPWLVDGYVGVRVPNRRTR